MLRIVPGAIVGAVDREYLIALDPEDPATWARTYEVGTGRLSALRPMTVWLKFVPEFASGKPDLWEWEEEAILDAARHPLLIEEPQEDLSSALPEVDILRAPR